MQACWEIEYHIAKALIYKHEICTVCKLFLSFSMAYLSEYKMYNCVFVALSVITKVLFITFLLSPLVTHWGRGKMAAIFKCIFLNENV